VKIEDLCIACKNRLQDILLVKEKGNVVSEFEGLVTDALVDSLENC